MPPSPTAPARPHELRRWAPAMLAWQVPVACALLALGAWSGTAPFLLPAVAWLAASTPELIRVDVVAHRLPDRLTLPGYPLALAGGAVAALSGAPVLPPLLIGAGFFGIFLVLGIGGGMGLGDVKLAGVLGLILGASGLEAAFVALLVAFISGGVAAVCVLVRHGRSARIPFGPFLLAGFWVALPLGVA